MTVSDFLTKLKTIESKYKTVYMWGCIGAPVTTESIASRAAQYPDWYTAAKKNSLYALCGKGYFGFDCVNLIKSILWGWCGDASRTYGGAKVDYNVVLDLDANAMIKVCKDVSTDFKNIIPGEAVWQTGHIGVYIGEGRVIECTPSWANGVQISACLNIGAISGLQERKWTSHGKLPYIDYKEEEEVTQEQFNKMMDAYLAERGKLPAHSKIKTEFEEAKAEGITDGTRPRDFAARDEVAVMIRRAMKK